MKPQDVSIVARLNGVLKNELTASKPVLSAFANVQELGFGILGRARVQRVDR